MRQQLSADLERYRQKALDLGASNANDSQGRTNSGGRAGTDEVPDTAMFRIRRRRPTVPPTP